MVKNRGPSRGTARSIRAVQPEEAATVTGTAASSPKRQTIAIACHRCRSRKVKCSGGKPCIGCRQASKEAECAYPRRNRLVKVEQTYIDDLIEENRRLRSQRGYDPDAAPAPPEPHRSSTQTNGSTIAEPSVSEPSWFHMQVAPHMPIIMGETSDSGSASRFRQAMADKQLDHLPRLNYPPDDQLMAAPIFEQPWPPAFKAQMLLNVALKHVGGAKYHVVRKSQIWDNLQQISQNPNAGSSIAKSQLLVLFAIGELLSARTAQKDGMNYPGLLYFQQAIQARHIVNERPHIESVELGLLFTLYSMAINRRHSAYWFAGSAMRTALVLGLQLNVPESQMRDAAMREHCKRVFWTAYILDRLCSLALGNPVAVADVDVIVDLPKELDIGPDANLSSSGSTSEDFGDVDFLVARVRLAQLSSRILQSIYVRRSQRRPQEIRLAPRVQEVLKAFRTWLEELPSHLQLNTNSVSDANPSAVMLQLAFNQSIIVATRPVLCHILRARAAAWKASAAEPQVPESAATLAEACCTCARQSLRLLCEAWAIGAFPTLDWAHPQYIFSSVIVLAVSNILTAHEPRPDDIEQFDAAMDILKQLDASGNILTQEFFQHFEAIKQVMNCLPADRRVFGSSYPLASTSTAQMGLHTTLDGLADGVASAQVANDPAMAPSLQELLMQPSLDLQFFDDTFFQDMSHGLYWHDLTPGASTNASWTPG